MERVVQSYARRIETPAFIVFEDLLRRNLEVLDEVQNQSGAKILLAQKCFSMFHFYPLIEKYLWGTASSGLNESLLAEEFMPLREKHVFSPAYRADEIEKISEICDHVIFNSFEQIEKFGSIVRSKNHSIGLRLNPEHSTQTHAIYDPCNPQSRFGVRKSRFDSETRSEILNSIEGFHMHTLCEQNSDALEETVEIFEEKFLQDSKKFPNLKWLNLGGGHLITRENYDRSRLINLIRRLRSQYKLEIYLEPGEAIAIDSGFLISTILEIQEPINGISNVILDTSAACHMPDVLEMPYRPEILETSEQKKFPYRFTGGTCLAGDVIGEYEIDRELREGDRIIFRDMAIYSMVKTNTFNGINLPRIIAIDSNGKISYEKIFGYDDFKSRL
ncbi:MAG: carboxynorspermidine decarboxylase [Selenomonadaceae bacterium]|nr:carboxynorspermidine decarboxylase [Selenomonadaceae bacterium]